MRPLIILDADDAGRMSHLHSAAFPEAERWTTLAIGGLMNLDSVHAFGIEGDIGLSGFIMVQRAGDTAEILTLATAPNFRRQGAARALVDAARVRLGQFGTAKLLLDVAEDNLGALAFYTAYGFKPDGKRRGYYTKGREAPVDAILMSLEIAGQN